MKFDSPATANPIDNQRVIGKPVNRIEGPMKVTGRALYAYERHDEVPDAAYGYLVTSPIAKGRVTEIDTAVAESAPGVIAVITWKNAGKLAKAKANTAKLLGGPEIEHYGQALALVVAESFEQARDAAQLVDIATVSEEGHYDLAAELESADPVSLNPLSDKPGFEDYVPPPPGDTHGDFESAYAAADVALDEFYSTADESHCMMEPYATTAEWVDDGVTMWTSTQGIQWTIVSIAETFLIPQEKIRVIAPFVGGAFGAKIRIRSDAVLAVLGAKITGRAVKLAVAGHQVMNNGIHRPATIQRLKIGAGRDGRITAFSHESWSGNLPGGRPEIAAERTKLNYAGENRFALMRQAVLDLPEGNSMRAPGEAPASAVLEIAMDEMAEKLGIDPVEFRILNDTQVDPFNPERSFSQRQFIEALRVGAERFGWERRNAQPGTVREGRWQIGMGVAAALRGNQLMPSAARVRLDKSGTLTVETDMTDIGNGSYTIIAQTAAEMLGVPIEKVDVRLADSRYPRSAQSGGQWGANCSTAGVYAACVQLREKVASQLGVADLGSVDFVDGNVVYGDRSHRLTDAVGSAPLEAEDGIQFGEFTKEVEQQTFGAHFVEVAVDSLTSETRVRRMLAVCASGRILNPKSARNQVIGGMTMGMGAALMEELAVDKNHGFFANHDLAGYEIPAHADVPEQEVIFLEETDPMSSPMKAKGVAEIGLCGAAAAVANAIYNATGARVRSYPITVDKIMSNRTA
ncbi:aldehyde oxidoreductase molybdenum-binding subunit PaoC [Streptomyces sp. NPDC005549]|uniref:aldehyde oxidoreductase molybdenum-binding subunit PaoC n=1 Tax=Streptomyces sp. NPDC005549 TaxID=3154888 RepID=UPI0033B0C539